MTLFIALVVGSTPSGRKNFFVKKGERERERECHRTDQNIKRKEVQFNLVKYPLISVKGLVVSVCALYFNDPSSSPNFLFSAKVLKK